MAEINSPIDCYSARYKNLKSGVRVRIRHGFVAAGMEGSVVFGSVLLDRTWWTALVLDEATEPIWCQTDRLERVIPLVTKGR